MTRYTFKENNRKPISFKTATIIVLGLHILTFIVVLCVPHAKKILFASNQQITTKQIKHTKAPYSDALEKAIQQTNKQHHKTKPIIANQQHTTTLESPKLPAEYTLKPGDNLYKISRDFNVSFEVLKKYNNVADPRNLVVGQVLKIPHTRANL